MQPVETPYGKLSHHCSLYAHKEFQKLHQYERDSIFDCEMFNEQLDCPLENIRYMGKVQTKILKSMGIRTLSDVLVIGWDHNSFRYTRAKRVLYKIDGIGPRTIDRLMREIVRIFIMENTLKRVLNLLMKENPEEAVEDSLFFHSWSKQLRVQYEEIKQTVNEFRQQQQKQFLAREA